MSAADKAREVVQDLTGMWWPAGDEGELREAARAWRTFADAVGDVTGVAHKAAKSLIENNRGPSIDAFSEFWARYYHGGHGWLKDLADGSRDMADALDKYADAVAGAKKKLEHELEIVGATIVAGTALAIFTAGISEGAALAAAATITELAGTLGVAVSTEVATIAGTTLATAALGGIESVTVDLAVTQPVAIATGEQHGLNLDEVQDAGLTGALFGGALGGAATGGPAALRALDEAGGLRNLYLNPLADIGGPRLATAGLPGDSGMLLRDGEPNAWPRIKRKGPTQPKYHADLAGDEGQKGAHTIARHVEKTDTELRARLRADPNISGSSSFVDEASAQRFADAAIVQHQSEIERWLAGSRRDPKIEEEFAEPTGRSLSREHFVRGTGPHDVYGVRLILRRDADMPNGFRVHTAFPTG